MVFYINLQSLRFISPYHFMFSNLLFLKRNLVNVPLKIIFLKKFFVLSQLQIPTLKQWKRYNQKMSKLGEQINQG
jgi:hypothetical protein